MKKWIASLATLALVLALALPVAGAERAADTESGWNLDLQQVVHWLATLWGDPEPVDASTDETPRAFIEKVGPYIVPVGLDTPSPDSIEQTSDEESEPQDP